MLGMGSGKVFTVLNRLGTGQSDELKTVAALKVCLCLPAPWMLDYSVCVGLGGGFMAFSPHAFVRPCKGGKGSIGKRCLGVLG
jgi:hypothetical protein